MNTTAEPRALRRQLATQAQRVPALPELLDRDPDRFANFHIDAPRLQLNLARQRWTGAIRTTLGQLAHAHDVEQARAQLFRANGLNNTEGRAALHTALRAPLDQPLLLEGHNVMTDVAAAHQRMASWSAALRSGRWRGAGNHAIRDVVNIGIGGSFLGPALICEALGPATGPQPHFLSNIDGTEAERLLPTLDPQRTLFIIASKSFSTVETRENAMTARRWLIQRGIPADRIHQHFVAISTNEAAAAEFGVPRDQLLPLWDWVGGRFSVCSAIGLVIAISHGFAAFQALLAGARAMDLHFRDQPCDRNAPMQLALAEYWNQNCLGLESHAVLPYSSALARLPDYLQQLEMESNGKSVARNGEPVTERTGTVLWGNVGTNGQHAYHQLLHQGTAPFSAELILSRHHGQTLSHHHQWLVANALAQAEVLARGRSRAAAEQALQDAGHPAAEIERLAPHYIMPGNHPSSLVLLDDLSAESLGALIALHEHKVFVQGIIWNVNSFDQWGVELGKQLGKRVHAALQADANGDPNGGDAITRALIEQFRTASARR